MTKNPVLICADAAIPVAEEHTYFDLIPLTCQIESQSLVCFLGPRFNILNLYLQMLAGLTDPQSGNVDYFIVEQTAPSYTHLPPIAYLSYQSTLLSVLNGLENVKLPAVYHQLGSRQEVEKQAEALINELKYDANHKVLPAFMTTLQKRHLLIARALILKPKLLFIENPFAGLELEEAAILGEYLANLVNTKNITLVTSNANLDFVEHYARQIIYADAEKFLFFNQWQRFSDYKQLNRLKF